jgi:hypothetical protein
MTVSRFQGCSCLDGQAATEAPAGRRAEELGKELRGGFSESPASPLFHFLCDEDRWLGGL